MRQTIDRISWLERLHNSVNGNPRYRVHFESGEIAITKSDASYCYGITNPEMKGDVVVTYTRAGRIDTMRPATRVELGYVEATESDRRRTSEDIAATESDRRRTSEDIAAGHERRKLRVEVVATIGLGEFDHVYEAASDILEKFYPGVLVDRVEHPDRVRSQAVIDTLDWLFNGGKAPL